MNIFTIIFHVCHGFAQETFREVMQSFQPLQSWMCLCEKHVLKTKEVQELPLFFLVCKEVTRSRPLSEPGWGWAVLAVGLGPFLMGPPAISCQAGEGVPWARPGRLCRGARSLSRGQGRTKPRPARAGPQQLPGRKAEKAVEPRLEQAGPWL